MRHTATDRVIVVVDRLRNRLWRLPVLVNQLKLNDIAIKVVPDGLSKGRGLVYRRCDPALCAVNNGWHRRRQFIISRDQCPCRVS